MNKYILIKHCRYFLPVIEAVEDENAFLTEHPKRILEEGGSAKVPWLVVVNSAEGLLEAIRKGAIRSAVLIFNTQV